MSTDGILHCTCKDLEIMKTCGHLEEVKRAMDKFGIEKPEVRYTFRSATNVTPPGFPTGWTPLVPANKDRTITEGEVEELRDTIDKVNIIELYKIFPVQEGNGVPQHDSCGYCRAHHSYEQGCDHCDAGGKLADHYSQDEEMYGETAEIISCNKCHNPVAINNTTDNEQAAFTLYCGSCKTITEESDGTYDSD